MDSSFWILQSLNALQYSLLLFLLSIGLTVIFGLLHFVNLAHGALYMLGAYLAYSVASWSGTFWAALVLSPLLVMAVAMLLYFTLIARMRQAEPMSQVLVTFGLIFVFLDLVGLGWGRVPLGLDEPDILKSTYSLLGVEYPRYRLFIIGLGLLVMILLSLLLSRTAIGAMIRAGVENGDMAACMGINVEQLFFWVFCLGAALAGLAGVVAAPVFSVSPDMGISVLIPALIVVVIGGLGSLRGAILGSFIVGFVETLGAAIFPTYASVLVYILLAAVLIWRPAGLIPARA